jgi:hypothetical protein
MVCKARCVSQLTCVAQLNLKERTERLIDCEILLVLRCKKLNNLNLAAVVNEVTRAVKIKNEAQNNSNQILCVYIYRCNTLTWQIY